MQPPKANLSIPKRTKSSQNVVRRNYSDRKEFEYSQKSNQSAKHQYSSKKLPAQNFLEINHPEFDEQASSFQDLSSQRSSCSNRPIVDNGFYSARVFNRKESTSVQHLEIKAGKNEQKVNMSQNQLRKKSKLVPNIVIEPLPLAQASH